jgi:hypothetical protein
MTAKLDKFTPVEVARIRATFADCPDAQIVCVEMGHGYGGARFLGQCSLTGDRIERGETIRFLRLAFRNGQWWTGYTSARVVGLLGFQGAGWQVTNEDGEKLFVSEDGEILTRKQATPRCVRLDPYGASASVPALVGDWKQDILSAIDDAEAGTVITVARKGAQPSRVSSFSCHSAEGVDSWHFDGQKWSKRGAYSRTTGAQFAASIRRRKDCILYRVSSR